MTAGFEQARAIVQADGADFELLGVDDGAVSLRLVLVEAGCAECVMPQQFLEGVVLDIMREADATVRVVHIDDPR